MKELLTLLAATGTSPAEKEAQGASVLVIKLFKMTNIYGHLCTQLCGVTKRREMLCLSFLLGQIYSGTLEGGSKGEKLRKKGDR